MKLAKTTSPVWQYYKLSEKDNKIAICNVCEAEIPRGGTQLRHFNTTILIRHLRIRNVKEYSDYKKQASAKSLKLA